MRFSSGPCPHYFTEECPRSFVKMSATPGPRQTPLYGVTCSRDLEERPGWEPGERDLHWLAFSRELPAGLGHAAAFAKHSRTFFTALSVKFARTETSPSSPGGSSLIAFSGCSWPEPDFWVCLRLPQGAQHLPPCIPPSGSTPAGRGQAQGNPLDTSRGSLAGRESRTIKTAREQTLFHSRLQGCLWRTRSAAEGTQATKFPFCLGVLRARKQLSRERTWGKVPRFPLQSAPRPCSAAGSVSQLGQAPRSHEIHGLEKRHLSRLGSALWGLKEYMRDSHPLFVETVQRAALSFARSATCHQSEVYSVAGPAPLAGGHQRMLSAHTLGLSGSQTLLTKGPALN
ncbi:uncharacterized protein LOC132655350 [Meriones unguiculatus]|uniref:uncharacterized protein LOC132655350 n=1 Tax=Meriones unguiculatus TaxID=10047 RepID=UPI00293F1C83|nr:uncharacterized protein LOC132655350 [Meriones unguiculatus]